jgi:hypothetical protein
VRGWETPTILGMLDGPNLNYWCSDWGLDSANEIFIRNPKSLCVHIMGYQFTLKSASVTAQGMTQYATGSVQAHENKHKYKGSLIERKQKYSCEYTRAQSKINLIPPYVRSCYV